MGIRIGFIGWVDFKVHEGWNGFVGVPRASMS